LNAAVKAVILMNALYGSKAPETFEDFGEHFARLEKRRLHRARLISRWKRWLERMPMSERSGFLLTEVADQCARVNGRSAPDQSLRDQTIELVRCAILRGQFQDTQGRSKIACFSPHPSFPIRVDLEIAADPDFFKLAVPYLCVNREYCEKWFSNNKIAFPKEWKKSLRPGRKDGYPWEKAGADLNRRTKKNGLFRSKKGMVEAVKDSVSRADEIPDNHTINDQIEKRGWMRFVAKG
jgi:hypothetical protein